MNNLINLTKNLCLCYTKLVEINEKFCKADITSEVFQNLTDQRDLISEDIELICKKITSHQMIIDINIEIPINPFRALLHLAQNNSEVDTEIKELKTLLERLTISDKSVEDLINNQKSTIKAEVNKLKRGAKKLRGYIQHTHTGSCFINKIK